MDQYVKECQYDKLEQERIAKYKIISNYTPEEWKEYKRLKFINEFDIKTQFQMKYEFAHYFVL
jgi:hypothetical protein